MNSYEDPLFAYECDSERRIVELETQVNELREALELIVKRDANEGIERLKNALFLAAPEIESKARAILEKTK